MANAADAAAELCSKFLEWNITSRRSAFLHSVLIDAHEACPHISLLGLLRVLQTPSFQGAGNAVYSVLPGIGQHVICASHEILSPDRVRKGSTQAPIPWANHIGTLGPNKWLV